MRSVFAVFVIAVLQCCGSAAMALGFGPVTNATRLGQALDFTVAVKLDADETLSPSCVSADVSAGDSHLASSQVRTRLVRNGRASDALVRITSTTRVREPVVTVVLSLGCPPRVARKFVSLLDPAPAAPPRGETMTKTALAAAALVHAAAPGVAAAAAEAAEAASAPVDAEPRAANDSEQLKAMQERVEQLRQGQQALQQNLAALQAKLRETEEGRHDPALYGLATLVVLLLGVVIALLWRMQRQRSDEAWLRDAEALTASRPHGAGARAAPPPVMQEHEDTAASAMRVVPDSKLASPATVPPQAPAVDAPGPTIPESASVRRELTPDELIDLEQQADFFIALGQEESAIDLLMAHVRSSGGTSPMPYLKLLEIYRRRGEVEAYQRVAERFSRRFNVRVDDWDGDPAQSRPLGDYPEIVQRITRAWPTPARAADLLEALLFRRDPLQAGFDVAAYEELLFLYALAKDLAGTQGNGDGVDLLLPLEIGDAAPAITHVTAAASRGAAEDAEVDLDLRTQPGAAPTAS
jgi:hypothetical protein